MSDQKHRTLKSECRVNTLAIKSARAKLGMTTMDMAKYLNCSYPHYNGAELGHNGFFSEREKFLLIELFKWSIDEANEYLYEGKLPFCKK